MSNPILSPGKRAPAFTLKADEGPRLRLTEHRGRWIVLFFCPCTSFKSGCGSLQAFNGYLRKFKEAEAFLIGVTNVKIDQVGAMRKESGLPFPILSDSNFAVGSKYGVWREIKRGGKNYMAYIRGTFILDPSGKVMAIWDNWRVNGHVEKVWEELCRLQSAE